MKLEIFGNTIIGKVRDHNEDSFVFCNNIETPEFIFSPKESISFEIKGYGSVMCVADGMGGTNAGEIASHESVNFIKKYFSDKTNFEGKETEKVLVDAIIKTNDHLNEYVKSHTESKGMGTTMVLSLIKNDTLSVAWIGDSRCYKTNPNNDKFLFPFTDDHSMVWELVQSNQMTAEQARVHPQSNIITQSLGDSVNKVKPSFKSTILKEGDIVILCSDGLNGMLSDCSIDMISRENTDAKEICNRLIEDANEAGGEDNITVIVSKILQVDNPSNIVKGSVNSIKQTNYSIPKKKSNKLLLPGIAALAGIVIGLLLGYFIFNTIEQEQADERATEVIDEINSKKNTNSEEIGKETSTEEVADQSKEESTVREGAKNDQETTSKEREGVNASKQGEKKSTNTDSDVEKSSDKDAKNVSQNKGTNDNETKKVLNKKAETTKGTPTIIIKNEQLAKEPLTKEGGKSPMNDKKVEEKNSSLKDENKNSTQNSKN